MGILDKHREGLKKLSMLLVGGYIGFTIRDWYDILSPKPEDKYLTNLITTLARLQEDDYETQLKEWVKSSQEKIHFFDGEGTPAERHLAEAIAFVAKLHNPPPPEEMAKIQHKIQNILDSDINARKEFDSLIAPDYNPKADAVADALVSEEFPLDKVGQTPTPTEQE